MSKVIYDFSGKMIDRSEVKYEFDGLNASITIEDQDNVSGFLELSFCKVASFTFDTISILDIYPVDIAEKLVEKQISPASISLLSQRSESFFKEVRKYEVFLEDIGTFTIIACSAEVRKLP